ncbi:MAG TPA: asparagine synthase (glutamine-hydrolyzing) [Bacteroidia bacterium]|nr:asparagine synthase (glutamine-hydrolyzing) [Bacteroidia bacterium]
MCGIAGIINLTENSDSIVKNVSLMTNAIRHRGPDGEGFLILKSNRYILTAFGKDTPPSVISSSFNYAPKQAIDDITDDIRFVFGHRRLAIIDTSPAGHQPMCDAEKKIWIVFNGEIYNYIELREELITKGISFRTTTDTEVIIQSYLFWGEDCIKHFNGMWSFVIYDARKNIVFGSRDRVGVKPLYYYKSAKLFAFASEQKALHKLPFVQTGINPVSAAAFLAGNIEYIEHGEENMFKNIYELMPGHNFKIDLTNNSFTNWQYYTLSAQTHSFGFNQIKFNEYRDKTETLFVEAVKLRLRSDVPIGSCLSGGIDSSAIVCVTNRLNFSANKLNVFTLKFNDKAIDETGWAKYVVDQTNSQWNLVSPSSADLLHDFSEINYAQDIPIGTTGTYGQFSLMRAAKEKGIKVVLDGQGSDELFGGYLPHSFVFWKELLKNGKLHNAISEMSANGKLLFNINYFSKELIKNALPKKLFHILSFKHHYLNKEIVMQYLYSSIPRLETSMIRSTNLNSALMKEFSNARLKMYLKYEDRSSMWHSVEARTPFADDHRLTEYVFSIPGSYKIHKGINKFLLREAMKNYLPKEIKERKDKLGLVTPIQKWISEIKNDCLDFFDDSVGDYVNVKKLKSNPDRFFTVCNHADAHKVFRTISFAVWKKAFNL